MLISNLLCIKYLYITYYILGGNMNNMIVDGHCDSLNEAYKEKINLDNNKLMFNIKKARKPYMQFLATFINDDAIKDDNDGYDLGSRIIDYWYSQYSFLKESNNLIHIKNREDIDSLGDNKIGILLTTENGSVIGNNKENIVKLYERGIRIMGITWNGDNLLGCGALTKNDTGLTKFGKECIKIMNDLGIIIDVSHTSYNTFYDIINIANKVIATHSNVYTLKNHPRNLYDNQIKEIAKLNGVVGVCFCKDFLTSNESATIDDIIEHIKYIASLVGEKHIVIGSDFDGIEKNDLPINITGVEDMLKIEEALGMNSFSKNSIENIMGRNYIRYLKNSLK